MTPSAEKRISIKAWGEDRIFECELQKTALLIIDMQMDFISPGGACAAAAGDGIALKEFVSLVDRLKKVLEMARLVNCTIIHTKYGFKSDLSDLNEVARQHSRAAGAEYGSQGPLGRILVQGEQGFAIVPELFPLENELVLRKTSFGAFATTDLEFHLRSRGITHLFISGVTTQCCVESTLREAVDRGFFCCTLADGTATVDPILHSNTLRAIQSEDNLFGWIASCQDLLDALFRIVDDDDSSPLSNNSIACADADTRVQHHETTMSTKICSRILNRMISSSSMFRKTRIVSDASSSDGDNNNNSNLKEY